MWIIKKDAGILANFSKTIVMKKIFLTAIVIIYAFILHAQQQMASCCAPTATEKFALNASDKAFIMSHENPLPFIFKSQRGKDITYAAAGGSDAHAWQIMAKSKTNYYIFVIHEWWGLNDYIKQEAEKLSDDLEVNVIALDLYDGNVAATADDASKYMSGVKTERATAIIKGAFTYAGKDAEVFTIGWCFGGGWSLQTAIEGGTQVKGCIMYYGQPEKNIDRLKTLNCDVLGIFANKDQWITPAVVDEFRQNMQTAGKKINIYQYDADHAFANPSNPHFDKAASADAYNKALTFIKLRMR